MTPPLISKAVTAAAPELAARFAQRAPFRHVVIDGFFSESLLQALRTDFPVFEHGNARNESGELAGKSVVERIRALGPAYAQLDDLMQSRGFLDWISQITGISDLLYDPHYFGGGTHENRRGQDLDPHVDFNLHPITGWHRRLNLIIYLNPEWDDAWGGSLELHSDPRRPDNQITLVTPLLNRAVIFETTEWSWHGFSRIAPPADRANVSRRSIALYFYTRERPDEERADPHSTIYVDRPLPPQLRAGHTLTDEDEQQLRTLVARRDQHIQRLYRDTQRLETELIEAQKILAMSRLSRIRRLIRHLIAGKPGR
ncbi:MAG TPA: 2OG-Fe(II) oxygenase [Xanthomonadales bacterium]|nr:2OG-Fe(II) oxygenase [Xanthomonadales bacterium]